MTTTTTNEQTTANVSNLVLKVADNVTLRPMRLSDAEDMAHHANNRKIWANLRDGFPHPYTVEHARSFLNMVQDQKMWINSGPGIGEGADRVWNGPLLPSGMAIAVDDRLVGTIGLKPGEDVHRRCAEIGYWLSEEHWGKGIMSKAVPAFITWVWHAFEKLVRIESGTYSWNPTSAKVLQKSGFEYVGLKKAYVWKAGQVGDVLDWELIRDEFKN